MAIEFLINSRAFKISFSISLPNIFVHHNNITVKLTTILKKLKRVIMTSKKKMLKRNKLKSIRKCDFIFYIKVKLILLCPKKC